MAQTPSRTQHHADRAFQPFTIKLMWQEVAPHTWPAAIMPTLIALVLSVLSTNGNGQSISLITALVLLVIVILMLSSVNTFNDYFDYVKGVDTPDTSSTDVSDAIFVYYNVNPKSGLALAVGLLASAFGLGIYIICISGVVPLLIALVGAVIVAAYSGGKTPISYYPIGEVVSGFVMGGLIPLADYYVLTGTLDFWVLPYTIPCMIGIGLIMMSNNISDIEKDTQAQRKTLAVVLGRPTCTSLYHGLYGCWVVSIVLISMWVCFNLTHSISSLASVLFMVPVMGLCILPSARALMNNPLTFATRDMTMPQILGQNVMLGAFFCIMLLLGAFAPFALV